MSNNSSEEERLSEVTFQLNTARYLLRTAKALIDRLYAVNWNPSTGAQVDQPTLDAVMEEVENDSNLFHWLVTASQLLRLLAGVLAHQLNDDWDQPGLGLLAAAANSVEALSSFSALSGDSNSPGNDDDSSDNIIYGPFDLGPDEHDYLDDVGSI